MSHGWDQTERMHRIDDLYRAISHKMIGHFDATTARERGLAAVLALNPSADEVPELRARAMQFIGSDAAGDASSPAWMERNALLLDVINDLAEQIGETGV